MYKHLKIDISTRTIVKLVAVLVLLTFLYFITDIIVAFFIAIVIAAAVDPLVDFLQKYKIPRAVSVIFIYLIFLGIIALTIYLLIPPISKQFIELGQKLPLYFERFSDTFRWFSDVSLKYNIKYNVEGNVQNLFGSIGKGLSATASGAYSAIASFFGGFVAIITILVLSFYLVVEENAIKKFIKSVIPEDYQNYVSDLVNRIQKKLGAWLRGQLVLSLIIAIFSYIGLLILGVDYALVLALLAGLFELIPVIGPIIAAIPALFIAFTQSPILALFVLIMYIVIQQVENHILVPKVMQKAVGLSPVIIILAMLIGARLAGILGILLAVPFVTVASVFIKDFYGERIEKRSRVVMKSDTGIKDGSTEKK